MPGKEMKKKELYLGKCLDDLHRLTEIKQLGNNINIIVKSSDKVFRDAEMYDNQGDEERAFIMYLKYFNILKHIKSKADYKKQKSFFDELIGTKNQIQAIGRAEKLSDSLKERYDFKEAEAVAKKLANADTVAQPKEEKELEVESSVELKTKEKTSEVESRPSSIKCSDLCSMLRDPHSRLILMDVRSAGDFAQSHISHTDCINVPEEIIVPGSTVNHIQSKLSIESSKVWHQRKYVDYIILLDWKSTLRDVAIGSTLRTLKDALFKFDLNTIIKSEPLILEGGYEQWLLFYPTMTTNAHVARPSDLKKDNLPSPTLTLDFDYPELDENLKKISKDANSKTDISAREATVSSDEAAHQSLQISMPKFDRSLKPNTGGDQQLGNNGVTINPAINSRGQSETPNTSDPINNESASSTNGNGNLGGLYPNMLNNTNLTKNDIKKNNNLITDSLDSGYNSIDLSVKNSSVNINSSTAVVNREKDERKFLDSKLSQGNAAKEDESRLEDAEKKLRELELMKKKEERDVADLMRMKRKLKEELDAEKKRQEEDLQHQIAEEKERKREWEIAQAEEEERKQRMMAVEKLRSERKKEQKINAMLKEQEMETQNTLDAEKEDDQFVQEEKEAERVKKVQEEEEKINFIDKRRLSKDVEMKQIIEEKKIKEEMAAKELMKEAEIEKQRKEAEEAARLLKLQEETDRQQKELKEANRLRKEQEEADRHRKELQDAARLRKEHEEAARLRREQEELARKNEEAARLRREQEESERKKVEAARLRKEQEESARKKAESEKMIEEASRLARLKEAEQTKMLKGGPATATAHLPTKVIPSTHLPVGWEKVLDRTTNRYFYINHNLGQTQWNPPAATHSTRAQDTYSTKLKDEPSFSSSHGLSRSHSSPDIMKQLADEERGRRLMPDVDRRNKPLASPSMQVVRQRAPTIRKRDLNPVFGNVGAALTGLRNLGNTCYMNSTIQCLSNTSPLVSYFLNDSYLHDVNRESSQGMHGEVVDDFAVVIKALWSEQYRSIMPRDLKNTIGKYNPMFAGYQQQDSQEFLTFLLDGLHEGLNEIKKAPLIPEQNNDNLLDRDAAAVAWKHHKMLHKSIIVELFQGQLKSTLMCRTCKKTSVTFQAFMSLSLPIPASSKCTLKDCIDEFLSPELMTGSSRWKCPQCKVDRDSQKKIDIWRLPHILLIGLNRFYSEGMWMQKKKTYVDFPVTDLDLSHSIIGPPPRNSFNLYGISNHYGTMEGGHYTACCRNPVNKKWYKYDDQDVYEISRSDIKTSAAFVLYYTSIELPPPHYKPSL